MSRALLIAGATGKQGGAVIRHLVSQDADFEILALTRDDTSPSAQRLAKSSPKIKLVKGDLDNAGAIFEAAKKVTSTPVWGVFSVQIPGMGFGHTNDELTQGKALVDAALTAGVKFFVYTSVDRHGETPTNIPHFAAKHAIEEHLKARTSNGEMDWAILRPVAFMDNFTDDFFGKFFATTWKIAVREKPLQLIAVEDIGVVGALAFLRPEEFKGRAISLAGDELTLGQFEAVFKRHTKRELPGTWAFVCRLFMWAVKDVGYMFRWFYEVGYAADIEEVRRIHPGLKSFETWLVEDSQFAKTAA